MKYYHFRLMVQLLEGDVKCVLLYNTVEEFVAFMEENLEWSAEWRGCWTEDNR